MFCHLSRRLCFFRTNGYQHLVPSVRLPNYSCILRTSTFLFRLALFFTGLIVGFSLFYRTTNMWALKNLGDSFLMKNIGRRPIIVGVFHRPQHERNLFGGSFAVIHFIGDTLQTHTLYCLSDDGNGHQRTSTALVERIHKGKRGANEICQWSGHLAECEIASDKVDKIRISTVKESLAIPDRSMEIELEKPLDFGTRLNLVVCVGAMYTYTDWQIMITGIETWMALGASKLIFPIQSASNDTYTILKEYERLGIVLLRHWPKWPLLSDVNVNGLVLSRGIEEAHVNCLWMAKHFSNMVVFTDIDDMLMPLDPLQVRPSINTNIFKDLFAEHPNAGSLLFEHRDVQFVLPTDTPIEKNSLSNFNFDFLAKSQWKTSCKVWRMKTRVVVNASRVDSVNMHETGIHRFGYAQVRIPCRKAHFYHLRHSYKNIALNEWPINMTTLMSNLNVQWRGRLGEMVPEVRAKILVRSSTESFEDFDRCMGSINSEHWTLRVSRCLTPHVCYSRLARNISCIATTGNFEFAYSAGDYVIALKRPRFVESDQNCEAPLPKFDNGNHFYLP